MLKKYKKSLEKYFYLSNYISAAQIYLKDNLWLKRKIKPEDIKARLLGHWGTVPGINLVYGTINAAIKEYKDLNFMYIVGPGHGFPAYQTGTFLDRSLENFYPERLSFTKSGLEELVYKFSQPYGFPSHINPEAPGAILEGGELGYSLATAFGAGFENRDLLITTLIGDGEAETGTLSSSWQLNRFYNPKRDALILPILHLNGYKISGPTIFSSFSDDELKNYFGAIGYKVFIVDYEKGNIFEDILVSYQDVVEFLLKERKRFDEDGDAVKPRLPLLVLKTPKGLSGPKELKGRKIEGTNLSHQVIFKNLKNDKEELETLNKWLKSYEFDKYLSLNENEDLVLDKDIEKIIPDLDRSIGFSEYARRGALELKFPDTESKSLSPASDMQDGSVSSVSSMDALGEYLEALFAENQRNFMLFSPDEADSNKIEEVFDKTSRVWMWPIHKWDSHMSKDGRVVSVLNENVLFSMLQGYTLTGRMGFFVSYESFAQIVSSILDQYVKFLKQARDVEWRKPVWPLNIVLSSLLERQDHNGFSHQNPSFIADNLDRDTDIVNVYFPADQNILLETLNESLKNKNSVNIFVVGKRNRNVFLNRENARKHVFAGASIWEDFSDDEPDIVLASAGDYITRESIESIHVLKKMFPRVKVRFVNFNQLNILSTRPLTDIEFLLGSDIPIVFNYHGYPATVKKLLYGVVKSCRVIVNGYREKGSTTTPFDMLSRNSISRFHTAKDMLTLLARFGKISFSELYEAHLELDKQIKSARDYAIQNGKDPEYLSFPE